MPRGAHPEVAVAASVAQLPGVDARALPRANVAHAAAEGAAAVGVLRQAAGCMECAQSASAKPDKPSPTTDVASREDWHTCVVVRSQCTLLQRQACGDRQGRLS